MAESIRSACCAEAAIEMKTSGTMASDFKRVDIGRQVDGWTGGPVDRWTGGPVDRCGEAELSFHVRSRPNRPEEHSRESLLSCEQSPWVSVESVRVRFPHR